MRGVDERNIVKDIRDSVRRGNDLIANNDFKRHNELFDRKLRATVPKPVLPTVSSRGGDMRNMVCEGRKKAQFKKAATVFMTHSVPVSNKVTHFFN